MTGCVTPTGEWKLDGTVKHTENESTSSPYSTPTPEVVYVTPTPEIIYVTVTPTPDPDPFICNDGELRDRSVCPGGQIIYAEYCDNNVWVPTGDVCPAPTPEPTPYFEPHRGGCAGLDQNVLRRYDHDKNGLIDSNEMKTAKIGYESNYEKQSNYEQILYAYEHNCRVWSTVSPTPSPTPIPTPEPTPTPAQTPAPETMFIDPVITIEPPIYSGVVRNNGEILDIRITPDPLIAGGDLRIEIDVLNTGTTETCYELEFLTRDPERWIYSGDMETFVFTSLIGDPGDRAWVFELYWDAEWPASNVLLQTATAAVHCYTQYEVDNM